MCAVSITSRGSVRRPAGEAEVVTPSPAANRLGSSRWRDPRLWVGALLVLASVVLGAKVLAAADNTVSVWALEHDAGAGMAIGPADVHAIRVHFTAPADQDRYLLTSEQLPAQAHLTRDVGAGEMLAKAALSTDTSTVPNQLPLGVPAGGSPADLAAGDRVEIWAVPKPEDAKRRSILVLGDVAVLAVSDSGGVGVSSDRQVVVALPESSDTSAILDSLNGVTVVLVRISG